MLSSLHIRNYVLIDSLDVEFPGGLVIISGPTGAGKSILIGALGLLCGARADASAIAEGAESCVLEAEFSTGDPSVKALCDENDIEYDGGHLIVRRTVSSSGRSRAFVNDSPVPLPVLTSLGALLVDIHSQHDTLLLTGRAYQLSALDHYAGNGELLASCASNYASLRELERRAESLRSKLEHMQEESDYNTAVYEQLRSADLREGELEELEAEQKQLANAEQIMELMGSAVELLDSSNSEGRGINADLSSLLKNVEKLSEYIPEMADTASRLESVRVELKDITEDISDRNGLLGADPDRLRWVDDRISLIYGLLKRHKCSDEAELISKRDFLAGLVCGGEDLKDELAGLEKEIEALAKEQASICEKLSKARVSAAGVFSREILSSLSFMELEHSAFEVSFARVEPGPSGADSVEFLFSAAGSHPVPVAKCASGGELSRLMLALKSVMSRHMNMPTMVFDEIDTGVSGSVADKMGSVICDAGSRMQVFAITHLPQVAAKGSAHYLVEKTIDGSRASSTIKKLSREERVLEVARMLSGSTLTSEAVANAKSLLD